MNSLVSAAGVIIVALIGVWTARLAKRSAQASANVEERAKIVEGYDKLNEDLQKRNEILNGVVARLETRVDELAEKGESDRRRIADLEFDKDNHRRSFETLLIYTKRLVAQLIVSDKEIPSPPSELQKYLDQLGD